MNTDTLQLSDGFQRLYCDPTVFESFSTFHPISFARVLPFQPGDPVVDDVNLIGAEEAHLADRNDLTRREVIEAYFRCGLLPEEEADNVKSVIDYFDADFFELMGLVYANAGMFICALRWYRELIAELETPKPDSHSGTFGEDVHASVGYCLYSLGLFAEAISWSKSCIGPDQITDVVCRALIGYEAQQAGGTVLAVERAGPRARYIISALDPTHFIQTIPRLEAAMSAFAPFHKIYIDVVTHDSSGPGIEPDGYPFRVEREAGSLLRHRMNLIFAICGQADALVESGHIAEARRLLHEAALLEPAAGIIRDRIKALP
jgi:tetratricopeptide (TPR) repeat protein